MRPIDSHRSPRVAPASPGDVWSRHWNEYQQALRLCRQSPSRKHVHALRIAARWLEAHLALLTRRRDPAFRSGTRKLKGLLRATSQARDAQVQSALATELWPPSARDDAVTFRRYLRARAARKVAALRTTLDSRPTRLRRLRPKRLIPHLALPAVPQPKVVQRVRAKVLARIDQPTVDEADFWHEIRIGVKKLRYLGEALTAMDGGANPIPTAALHSAQSTLGKLRDLDLLAQRLARFARGHPPAASSLERLRAALRNRRHRALRTSVTAVRRIARLLGNDGTAANWHSR